MFKNYNFNGNYFTLYVDKYDYDKLNNVIRKNYEILSYEIKRYNRESRKYVTRRYDLYRTYNLRNYYKFMVYRGLLSGIVDDLLSSGLLKSKPHFANIKITHPPHFLYDFQRYALLESINDINLQGESTIQIATGGGKTEVAIGLIKVFMDTIDIRKRPVFFVSLNKFLIRQFIERCDKYGIKATEVTGETKELSPITGATIQTLFKSIYDVTNDAELIKSFKEDKKILSSFGELDEIERADRLTDEFKVKLVTQFKKASLVIMDEVQHLPAFTVKQTLTHSPDSVRVGLSATPWRDDGLTNVIYAVTGLPSVKISFSELVKLNRLVPAIITFVLYSPPYKSLTYKQYGTSGYSNISKMLVDDAYRYCCITHLVKRIIKLGQTPLLILVRLIDMGKILNAFLTKNGIRSEFIYSVNSVTQRSYVIKQLTEGKLDCIIATTIADEGLDIPELRAMLILSGGKSSVKTYQRVGRVVRKFDDKRYGFVYDWVDLVKYYSEHSRIREEAYEKEKSWKIYKEFIRCPKCERFDGISAIKYVSDYIDADISDNINYMPPSRIPKKYRSIPVEEFEELTFE